MQVPPINLSSRSLRAVVVLLRLEVTKASTDDAGNKRQIATTQSRDPFVIEELSPVHGGDEQKARLLALLRRAPVKTRRETAIARGVFVHAIGRRSTGSIGLASQVEGNLLATVPRLRSGER
jgi:hypothetical protein